MRKAVAHIKTGKLSSDVFEINKNNVTVAFNLEIESRTTSVSVNIYAEEQIQNICFTVRV